jgi:hypothetical protein
MSRFPWFEAMLVAAMAVALIIKPPSRVVSAATQNLPPISRIEVGQTRKLGDGSVCSWVRVDARGEPTAIGVTMTEAVLSNLPRTGGNSTLLHLPSSINAMPFTQIVVDWNSGERPHFDFHFSRVDEATRQKVSLVKPTVTRTYLLSKPNSVEAVAQPKFYAAGVFPTQYAVKFDPQTHEYTIALEGLKRH